jgi:hypothetical protein
MICMSSVSDIGYLPILFLLFFSFFLMIDTRRMLLRSLLRLLSTIFPIPIFDYVIPVFLHWTRVSLESLLFIFRHLARFLELPSSR